MDTTSTSTLQTLARLSSKPGVQSTLILSRNDGAIIRSSGFTSSETDRSNTEPSDDTRDTTNQDGSALSYTPSLPPVTNDHQPAKPEEIARAVYRYVVEAENLTRVTGNGEDVQLMRLRTKKQELVIVPDHKYLMVVIQEASKAP